jgi:hypothetical protein
MLFKNAKAQLMRLPTAGTFFVEGATVALLFFLLAFAIILAWQDPVLYSIIFNQEDNFIEYAQWLLLLTLSYICLRRAWLLLHERERVFSLFCVFYGAMFLIVAGEEISWGQRLLNIETPPLFMQNNRQHELNIHNLKVGSNQFADFIYIAVEFFLAVYLLMIPFLYKFNNSAKMLVNYMALPIPKRYIICLIIVALFISEMIIDRWLVPREGDELTEFSVMYCIMLIFLFPINRALFCVQKSMTRS